MLPLPTSLFLCSLLAWLAQLALAVWQCGYMSLVLVVAFLMLTVFAWMDEREKYLRDTYCCAFDFIDGVIFLCQITLTSFLSGFASSGCFLTGSSCYWLGSFYRMLHIVWVCFLASFVFCFLSLLRLLFRRMVFFSFTSFFSFRDDLRDM